MKWELGKLGDVCDAIRGVTFGSGEASAEPSKDYIACLTTSAVQSEPAWATRRFIPRGKVSKAQYLRRGDLLVSTANSKDLVGKSCLIEAVAFECTFGAFVTVLRPKASCDPVLLGYWLRSAQAIDYFYTHSSNTTGISNLRVSDLLQFPVPIMPLQNQKRIAVRLSAAMAEIARAREIGSTRAKAMGALTPAILRQAFPVSPPLQAEADVMPARTGWRWVLLTDVARLESGHTPSRQHPEWWGGDVLWLALPDIRLLDGKVAMTTTENTNDEGLANSSARLLPKDTVALSRTASVGFATIFGRPMATSQDFVNWVCGDQIRPRFLMHLLRASRRYLLEIASGAVHKTIYMNTVERFRVCIPPVAEQDEIVARVDAQLEEAERISPLVDAEAASLEGLPGAVLRAAFED